MKKTNKIHPEKRAPIDFFYETKYKSNTANGIIEIYNKVYERIPCLDCNEKSVEIKRCIIDNYTPTFGILRKKYCLSCWLKRLAL